jgi:hypothetical protein
MRLAERVRDPLARLPPERPHPRQDRMAERQQRRRDEQQQRVLRHVDGEQDPRQPCDRRHERDDQRQPARDEGERRPFRDAVAGAGAAPQADESRRVENGADRQRHDHQRREVPFAGRR